MVKVIKIEMRIAKRMNEGSGLEAGDLRDQAGEQRIAGNIERHAEKHIRRTLVELAGKSSLRHIKLK